MGSKIRRGGRAGRWAALGTFLAGLQVPQVGVCKAMTALQHLGHSLLSVATSHSFGGPLPFWCSLLRWDLMLAIVAGCFGAVRDRGCKVRANEIQILGVPLGSQEFT